MDSKTLKYAKKNIDSIAEENGIKCYIMDDNLIIEVASGRNFELSEKEIKYQANSYLDSEKERIEFL
jgi:hypothetical protein